MELEIRGKQNMSPIRKHFILKIGTAKYSLKAVWSLKYIIKQLIELKYHHKNHYHNK